MTEGTVARRVVAPGSKSERQAIVLETSEGELVLRRQGANPFHDPELERLVGHRVRAEGKVHGHTLIMTAWEEV